MGAELSSSRTESLINNLLLGLTVVFFFFLFTIITNLHDRMPDSQGMRVVQWNEGRDPTYRVYWNMRA